LPLSVITMLTAAAQAQERVNFPSRDGRTTLVGYVFAPPGPPQPRPAVVMMHGRAGAYSSRANGKYDGATLSQRHRAWAELLARQGYVAILVDGFGPRGYPTGFPRGSYEDRPEQLNEVTVRPRDAYGALAYLRTRADVAPSRIALFGWSNGGSATLAAMAADDTLTPRAEREFRAGVVFYPACGLKGQFDRGYRPYAPVRVFMGEADEEVSPKRCAALINESRAAGSDISIQLYPGAEHSFDDPGARRQRVPANATASEDATPRVLRFLAQQLGAP
jgi:carboxymethylenebutenolidase